MTQDYDYTGWVQRAREGDEDAMAKLYENSYGLSHYIAMQLVSSEQDTLDILQNAYVRAFASLGSLQKPASFQSWMSRIVANTAKNFLKKKRTLTFSELTDEEGAAPDFVDERLEASPEEKLDTAETGRIVRQIIDSLSEEQRLVVMMYYFGDASVADIARDLAAPENTVKSRLNYARQKIKKEVERLRDEEGLKLYGAGPLALFAAGLWQQGAAAGFDSGAAWQLFEQVTRQLAPAAAGAAGAGATAAATGAAVAAGKAISGKVIAVIVAAAVGLGGVAGVLIGTNVVKPAPASSSVAAPSSEAPVVVSSQPAATPAPAPSAQPGFYDAAWRQLYYDVAVANLWAGEMVALDLSLYYTDAGDPLMSISYGLPDEHTDGSGQRYYSVSVDLIKVWQIKGGRAQLVFDRPNPLEGPGATDVMTSTYINIYVNLETGNPILQTYESSFIQTYYEIMDGNRVPLYRYDYAGTDGATLYSYSSDGTWTVEKMGRQPFHGISIRDASDKLALFSDLYDVLDDYTQRQRLGAYFLGEYTPPVPEEAPEWVSIYIQYLHSQWIYSYLGGQMPEQYQHEPPEVIFYEPLLPGGAPVLSTEIFFSSGIVVPSNLAIIDRSLFNFTHHYDGQYHFFKDQNGEVIIANNSYNAFNWFKPAPYGLDYLFSDGLYLGEPRVFTEFEEVLFGSQAEADAWLEETRTASLARHGLAPPLVDSQEWSYILPAEATWPEMEQALVNVLCQHARAIGQWGTEAG